PVSVKETFIDQEVLSVFYGNDNIGVVFRNNTEDEYKLIVYSSKGDVVSEKAFNFDYSDVVFSNGYYAIYGNTDLYVATLEGKTKLDIKYDKPIRLLIPTASPTKYVLVTDVSIDTVQMK
ncbi:MAG: hypothetical protein J6S95_00765, partial [Lachnospiraceae bacterium]|nr:hypothetical protein [Lachnospiraceae bacterium]